MSRRPKPVTDVMRSYVTAGYQLIPLHRSDYVDAKGKERGKSPVDATWQAKAYVSADVLKSAETSGNNVGVRLRPTDLILDVDPRNFPKGRDPLAELDLDIGLDLEKYPRVVTGSGGSHYYMRKPAALSILDSLKAYPGIEFKSVGRQVVSAGSVHPNGGLYRWDGSSPPLVAEVPSAPAALLGLIERPRLVYENAANAGTLSTEQLAASLEQLDVEDFREHDKWRDLMMACHHATNGEGRQEFIDWSTSDPKYRDDAWIIGRRWDSLHLDRPTGRPVTVKFLHKAVQEAGGHVPIDPPEDDFDEIEDVELGQGVDDKTLREAPAAANLLDEMNEKHAVVMEGGKFRVFTEQFDPVLERHYYARSTAFDFEKMYSNQFVETNDKMLSRGQWWLMQPSRRQYQGVIFDPEKTHDGWLNLWRGWSVEPSPGEWTMLKHLLLEVLCDGDETAYEYVLNWSAYMLQYPARAAEVALVFRGEKGTGKGTFGRILVKLAGAHGMHISSPSHLTGRFNSHLKDCLCLFADEAFWAGSKEGEAVLKQLVTEPTLTYEGKGRDAETGRNMIHIIMASNSNWVVPAGLDGERRFAVFEVNTKRQGDHAFFKALHREMDSGGYEGMLHELLNRDLSRFHPRSDVPKTKALADQVLQSMSDIDAWWFDKLQTGELPGQRDAWDKGFTTVVKEYIRSDYESFSKELGVRWRSSPTAFGMRLNQLVPGLMTPKVKATEEELGVMNSADGRVRVYVFPRLSECRAAFEKRLGIAMKWLDE